MEYTQLSLFGKKLEYCPICGRPLTSEAWAMLEKRLRGVRAWQNVVI